MGRDRVRHRHFAAGRLRQNAGPGGQPDQRSGRKRAREVGDGAVEVYDPRSYKAQSVPRRMAIISAGVVMNLIFACIFAAIAYRIGF